MWYIFFLPEPWNQENNCYLIIHQSIFPLDYVKLHIKSLKEGYEVDPYMVHNMTWSGLYMRIIFSSYLLQKVLTMALLIETGPEVYIDTTKTVISNSNDSLEDTFNCSSKIKLNSYLEEKVADYCTAI